MNNRLLFASSFLVLFAVTITASAQNNTPEMVVDQYFRFLEVEDWKSIADLTHPEALEDAIDIIRTFSSSNEATRKSMAESFGGSFSIDTLDKVDPRVVYAKFLEVMIGGLGKAVPGEVLDSEMEVVGPVLEGNDLAHVVYRITTELDGATIEKMMVQSVQTHHGRWLLLNGEEIASMKMMLPMLFKLSRSFGNEEGDDGIEWQDDRNDEDAENE